MPTQTLVYALPLPSPFTKKQEFTGQPSNDNQYVIQLTIPTSDKFSNGTTEIHASSGIRKHAKSSIMVWAGVGRVNQSAGSLKGNDKLDEYQTALAEELGEGSGTQEQVQFEGSRKLGDDWACAMPSTLRSNPVASSNLLIGIEADSSDMGAKSGRSRGMAERLGTYFERVHCRDSAKPRNSSGNAITAKRFQSQIFLSLDVPPAMSLLASMGSSEDSSAFRMAPLMGSRGIGGGLPGLDPLGDKLYLGLEKALIAVLEQTLS
ncbi:hypothetical protein QFC19_005800 [Naganishia cerealis]|uniref:Uncharacterized protein n=1 Tax=Naganishia cerealis TaxID=610337 RepID=A0ACC2VKR1_9TREE|nr:hypothetical protein QFC19_005800 [Naganishia cerealis]